MTTPEIKSCPDDNLGTILITDGSWPPDNQRVVTDPDEAAELFLDKFNSDVFMPSWVAYGKSDQEKKDYILKHMLCRDVENTDYLRYEADYIDMNFHRQDLIDFGFDPNLEFLKKLEIDYIVSDLLAIIRIDGEIKKTMFESHQDFDPYDLFFNFSKLEALSLEELYDLHREISDVYSDKYAELNKIEHYYYITKISKEAITEEGQSGPSCSLGTIRSQDNTEIPDEALIFLVGPGGYALIEGAKYLWSD